LLLLGYFKGLCLQLLDSLLLVDQVSIKLAHLISLLQEILLLVLKLFLFGLEHVLGVCYLRLFALYLIEHLIQL